MLMKVCGDLELRGETGGVIALTYSTFRARILLVIRLQLNLEHE